MHCAQFRFTWPSRDCLSRFSAGHAAGGVGNGFQSLVADGSSAVFARAECAGFDAVERRLDVGQQLLLVFSNGDLFFEPFDGVVGRMRRQV